MGKETQKQGRDFERVVSKDLHQLQREGVLRLVHRFVNSVGTPADFLAAGMEHTYLIECKSLIENKANLRNSLRLSCLTTNELHGMRAWETGANRVALVIWRLTQTDGQVLTYATRFNTINQLLRDGATRLVVDGKYAVKVGEGTGLSLLAYFRRYEQEW